MRPLENTRHTVYSSFNKGAPTKTLHVAFLVRRLTIGGAEGQLVTLAKGLRERGHQVSVFVYYPDGGLEGELQSARIPIRCIGKQGRYDILGFRKRLMNLLAAERPDILISFMNLANVLAILVRHRFPDMRVVWNLRSANEHLMQKGITETIVSKVEVMLSKKPQLIIANSEAGRISAEKRGFPPKRILVIPNGVNISKFKPLQAERSRIRMEWNLEESEIAIGIVARLVPVKNHPGFITAAAMLSKARKDVRFFCIGDGLDHYRRQLEQLARELGLGSRICFCGSRSDMPAVYSALDILTSNSITEGFSNVIVEGMACEKACVVTNAGDSSWIVDGCGVVVESQDPKDLCAGWNRCIEFGIQELGKKARQKVVDNFSVGKLVERTENALWKLV